MAFETFCSRVKDYMKDAKVKTVEFLREDGKHIARLPDGIIISGNSVSHRLCVEWGSGHKAFINA